MEKNQTTESNGTGSQADASSVDPVFTGPQIDTTSVPRLENLSGLFPSQDAVPTVPARKLNEQIRIVGGVPYIYDTANNVWIPLGSSGSSFAGRVNSGGSAGTPFPAGWTVSRSSAGIYVVTHNLGDAGYVVQLQVIATLAITIANVSSIGTNAFEARLYNHISGDTWTATDTDFSFVLVQG